MSDDPEHYFPSLSQLAKEQKLKDQVPIHISVMREDVSSIAHSNYESSETLDHLIKLVERQNELLESIDHAHYYNASPERKLLGRISLLLCCILLLGLFLTFSTLF